jgi:hypothetical protein
LQSLRFVHIPKTAGTTFSRILDKQYANKKRFLFTGSAVADEEAFRTIPESEQNQIKLFMGHAPLKTGIEAIDSVETVTFLRDPVERVKSFCQHVSEGKSSYLLKQFPIEDFDLDKFLNSGNLELTNLHCKMLTNTGTCASAIMMSPKDCLETAKSNLFNKIGAFGLLERFDESVLYFKETFNWNPPYYSKLNKRNEKKLLNFQAVHIEKIRQLNILDIELYHVAQKEFESRLEGVVTDKLLKQFRKENGKSKQEIPLLKKLIAVFKPQK